MTDLTLDMPDWLTEVRGFILDMDGVLYHGDRMIPEVPRFLSTLDAAGIPYTMATNNSTATPQSYVDKLGAMGIEIEAHSVVTSALATATYLRSRYPHGSRAYVIGMEGLRHAVFNDGHFVEATRDIDVVVSGLDFNLVYESLRIACLAIRSDADYVATNADVTFPTEEGLVPGAGAIVAALVAATDVEPTVVGKPSPVMVESALEIMGYDASEVVMLGDRLDTDILAGHRAGTHTIMVTTGISSLEDVETSGIEPKLIVPTLDPISDAIGNR